MISQPPETQHGTLMVASTLGRQAGTLCQYGVIRTRGSKASISRVQASRYSGTGRIDVGFRSRFRFFVVMIALSALSVITPTQTFAPFSEPPADGEISLETAAKRSFEFLHKIGHVITSKAYIGCLEPMARHRVWTIQDTARSFVIMVIPKQASSSFIETVNRSTIKTGSLIKVSRDTSPQQSPAGLM
jgi:hypothetical protein